MAGDSSFHWFIIHVPVKGIWSNELYIFPSEYANVVSLNQNKTATCFLPDWEIKGENAFVGGGARISGPGKHLCL